MIDPVRSELLVWIQASVGWAIVAARAVAARSTPAPAPAAMIRRARVVEEAPVRLRAVITIDIDACDAAEADRAMSAVRGAFEDLRRAHPSALLCFQRRRPRLTRRPPAPGLVVTPYVDD